MSLLSTPIIVQSASDIVSSVNDVTYIINTDLSGDVTFGTNCTVIFQGGKFTSGTIRGKETVIVAPMSVIFGNNATVVGTWKITKSYPEWFEPETRNVTVKIQEEPEVTEVRQVSDFATSINKAALMLTPEYDWNNQPRDPEDLNRVFYGGIVQLTGTYKVYSMIVIPRFVRLFGTNGHQSLIQLPESNYLVDSSFSKEVTRVANGVTHTKTVNAAIYFMNATFDNEFNNVAVGGQDFRLRLKEHNCHGIYVEKAYNQTKWENIYVSGVAPEYHAFHFTNSDEATQFAGQTVLMQNCIGRRAATSQNPDALGNPNLTPVYYFYRYQEMTLISCKAFSACSTSNGMNGGSCYQFIDCKGITMDGCSAAFAHTAILIQSRNRKPNGYTFSGLTSEGIGHYDLDGWGKAKYYDELNQLHDLNMYNITLNPIRHEGSISSYIRLVYCNNSYIVSTKRDQQVVLSNSSTGNTIISANPLVHCNDDGSNEAIGVPPGNACAVIQNGSSTYGFSIQDQFSVNGDFKVSGEASIDDKITINNLLTAKTTNNYGEILLGTSRRLRITPTGLRVEDIDYQNGGFSVYDNQSNAIFQTISNVASGYTGTNLWVNQGGRKLLRIRLGKIEPDGTRQLCIKDDTNTLNGAVATIGTLSERPTLSSRLYPGFFFYATDLNKPIWYNGQQWVDANGNTIS